MQKILAWEKHQGNVEIPFRPGRVILQDFTGVPAVVDFAAMRDAGNIISYRLRTPNEAFFKIKIPNFWA